MRVLAAELGLDGGAICSNGALTLDLGSGEIVRRRPLGTEVAARLVRELRSRLPGILFAAESEEFALEPGFAAWEWEPPAGTRYADGLELVAEPVAKLIVRHETHAPRPACGDEDDADAGGTGATERRTASLRERAVGAQQRPVEVDGG